MFPDLVRIQAWTEPAARRFGQVKAQQETSGSWIADMDVAIASVALELGAAVATCDVRRLQRVRDLGVQEWSAGQP